MLRSEEVEQILREVNKARDDMYDDVLRFRNTKDESSRLIARMAHSHLLSAYLELVNAIDLIEELEDRE